VLDRATNRVIISRGFASIYGEWESTGEAKSNGAPFPRAFAFPAPEGPVQVVIKKRGPAQRIPRSVVDSGEPCGRRGGASRSAEAERLGRDSKRVSA
jgi:hypothetical protein